MVSSKRDYYRLLSDSFRNIVNDLPLRVRDNFERTLQVTFRIKNIRNVQLWTRKGTVQRNFLHTGLSDNDKILRETLVELTQKHTLPDINETQRKIFPINNHPANGINLSGYLNTNYTLEYSYKLKFNGGDGSFEYHYFADSDQEEDDITQGNDSEFEEFFENPG